MKIIVTGSSGKLGKHVVADLLAAGHRVVPVDRRSVENPSGIATKVVDLLRLEEVLPLFDGVDAVCHLAGIPYIESDFVSGFSQNVTASYVVFEAACHAGVRKIIYASSVQAMGLFRTRHNQNVFSAPRYLPVDEDHPVLTQDAYPMSKAVGELIAESFSRRDPRAYILSLRFSGIILPEEWAQLKAQGVSEREAEPLSAALATYIHVKDAARAVRMAAEASGSGYAALNIVSPRSRSPWSKDELASTYGLVPEFRKPLGPTESLISPRRARETLGFEAELLPSGEPIDGRAS